MFRRTPPPHWKKLYSLHTPECPRSESRTTHSPDPRTPPAHRSRPTCTPSRSPPRGPGFRACHPEERSDEGSAVGLRIFIPRVKRRGICSCFHCFWVALANQVTTPDGFSRR